MVHKKRDLRVIDLHKAGKGNMVRCSIAIPQLSKVSHSAYLSKSTLTLHNVLVKCWCTDETKVELFGEEYYIWYKKGTKHKHKQIAPIV